MGRHKQSPETPLVEQLIAARATAADLGYALNLPMREVKMLISSETLPPPDKDGKLKLLQCIHRYLDMLRRAPRALSNISQAPGKERLVTARASLAELRAKQMQGKLLDVEEAEMIFAAGVAEATTRLLAVASKCALKVHAAKTAAQTQAIIYAAIEEALKDVSEFKLKHPGRIGPAGVHSGDLGKVGTAA